MVVKRTVTRKQETKSGSNNHTVVIHGDWKVDYETWAKTNIPFYTNSVEVRKCHFLHTNGAKEILLLEMQVTATDKTYMRWYYHIRAETEWDERNYGECDSANEGKFYPTVEKAMMAAEKRGERLDFLDRNKIKETIKKNRKELVMFYCSINKMKVV